MIKYITFYLILINSIFIGVNPVSSQSSRSVEHTIIVQNWQFVPDSLEISIGDTVIFRWTISANGHNVAQVDDSSDTEYNSGFYSGFPQNGPNNWTLNVDTSQNITLFYICEPHVVSNSMRGKIIVGSGSPNSDDRTNAIFWGIIISITILLGVGFVILVKKNQLQNI